jgi:hypothetical protein
MTLQSIIKPKHIFANFRVSHMPIQKGLKSVGQQENNYIEKLTLGHTVNLVFPKLFP